MSQRAILETWTFSAPSDGWTTIFPDGCCDLILVNRAGFAPALIASELDDQSRRIAVRQGETFHGLRLRPGFRLGDGVSQAQVVRALLDGNLPELDDLVVACPRTSGALLALRQAEGTSDAARALGVSRRTLQRVVAGATGRSPGWWRCLARARRAAGVLLSEQVELADLAADTGFADQAHMTREFQRWFRLSPGQLQRGGPSFEALKAKGYE